MIEITFGICLIVVVISFSVWIVTHKLKQKIDDANGRKHDE